MGAPLPHNQRPQYSGLGTLALKLRRSFFAGSFRACRCDGSANTAGAARDAALALYQIYDIKHDRSGIRRPERSRCVSGPCNAAGVTSPGCG
jgi:hypothetical protein